MWYIIKQQFRYRPAVRISGFHPGDPGSIPGIGDIFTFNFCKLWINLAVYYGNGLYLPQFYFWNLSILESRGYCIYFRFWNRDPFLMSKRLIQQYNQCIMILANQHLDMISIITWKYMAHDVSHERFSFYFQLIVNILTLIRLYCTKLIYFRIKRNRYKHINPFE